MKVGKADKRGSGRITAEDVARRLGVSQSTISRAFSPTASISEDMKKRVATAALELGYQPNIIARSLITRRTHMVAIVIGNLVDPFYTTLLRILTERLQASGRQVLLFSSGPGGDLETILPTLLQYQVDGIIITSATVTSDMARVCAKRETPVVLLNRYVPGVDIGAVSCDNVEGGRQVARYLVELGHRRPAFVAGQPDASTSLDRQQGFISGLAQAGISSCMVEQAGEYSYERGYEAALRLLAAGPPPDAVFFASDILAMGGMDAFRSKGLSIPEDLSVVGFNDVPLAAWPTYALTTVRHPWEEMAERVIAMLEREAGAPPKAATTALLPGELVVRSSTGPRAAPVPVPAPAARAPRRQGS